MLANAACRGSLSGVDAAKSVSIDFLGVSHDERFWRLLEATNHEVTKEAHMYAPVLHSNS